MILVTPDRRTETVYPILMNDHTKATRPCFSQGAHHVVLIFQILKHYFLFFKNDFYFFHYSWFTVFYQFSAIQQGDPVTHTYIYSFSPIILHHAPSQTTRYSSQCYTAGQGQFYNTGYALELLRVSNKHQVPGQM